MNRMPRYTSESRQDAYDYLRLLYRQRIITREKFQSEKGKIDRREAKSVALAEAKRAKREAEVLARREARKAETAKRNKDKAEAKKLVKMIPSGLLREKYTTVGSEESSVREMWKMTTGSRARFIGGQIDVTIDVEGRDKGYKSFRRHFLYDTNGNWKFASGDKFIILQPTPIEAVKLVQRFRDGINHCVFVPMIDKLSKLAMNSSDATKKRLNQRIKKLKAYAITYDAFVPEDKMEEVVKVSGCKFVLCDMFRNEIAVYNKDGRVGLLVGTNGRENHIDIGVIVESDPVELEQDDMNKLWTKVQSDYSANKEFYRIDGDFKHGTPTKICTLKGAWSVKDPMRDACMEFDKSLGIINYKVNAFEKPELNEFLRAGRIINSWSCGFNDAEPTRCADMPSAYTQFKKCHKYAGFLGHIHQFRSGAFSVDFVKEHLGYYQIIVRGGINWMFEKLGMAVGLSIVLFSPELLYFIDSGLEVDIIQGAWGSRFDFDFPDYMMQPIITNDKKERPYCIWSGRLGSERRETSHTIPATQDWASHLAVKHKVYYWRDMGLVTVKKPVKKCFTAHHILGGLTAYVRIQMMEAMKMFEPSQLISVVMDGIYYRGEKPLGLEWFKDKKATPTEKSMPWYDAEEVSKLSMFPPLSQIVGNTLLIGQGGSGKTYSVFNDKGFNNVLFVSPSHILGQDVHDRYGAKYTTIHRLIGIPSGIYECRPYYEDNGVPPVIFIDEITQIDASWIDKAFKMYPKSLILLAGDIDGEGRWFQCRSGDGNEWNTIWKPVGVQIIEYLEDRRSRDPKLKAIKLLIRDVMRACDLDNGVYLMDDWVRRNLPISKFEFVAGDTCIAGTHRTNEKLLELGVVSGYYKKGGHVSTVDKPDYKKRGSFTIHAYQGKTIETGNIWIFVDDLFEYAMLYTAISRAVNFSQIKFVRSRDL